VNDDELARAIRDFAPAPPTPAEFAALLAVLRFQVRRPSEVRVALQQRRRDWISHLRSAALLVAAQSRVLGWGFWTSSAAVAVLAGLAFSQTSLTHRFIVYMAGPLLAYLAVVFGFRAERARVIEYEFACPPSPRQLTLARLGLILGYQIAVGLCLSVLLSGADVAAVPTAVVLWLAPLLLGVGATLGLSFAMPTLRAATIVYLVWLTLLALCARTGLDANLISPAALALTLAAGAIALAVGIIFLPRHVPALLGHREPF